MEADSLHKIEFVVKAILERGEGYVGYEGEIANSQVIGSPSQLSHVDVEIDRQLFRGIAGVLVASLVVQLAAYGKAASVE